MMKNKDLYPVVTMVGDHYDFLLEEMHVPPGIELLRIPRYRKAPLEGPFDEVACRKENFGVEIKGFQVVLTVYVDELIFQDHERRGQKLKDLISEFGPFMWSFGERRRV